MAARSPSPRRHLRLAQFDSDPQCAEVGIWDACHPEAPVAIDDEVVIRPMMYIALSYDHRVVDGSTAVRFLVKVKELIEDPTTLLLEG